MTRIDDVINSAGHRISTGRLEEVINYHPNVVECAVIGSNHALRGESPLAFVILKQQRYSESDLDRIKIEVGNSIKKDVGVFARLEGVIVIEKLPKTRSGKIMRGLIKKIMND